MPPKPTALLHIFVHSCKGTIVADFKLLVTYIVGSGIGTQTIRRRILKFHVMISGFGSCLKGPFLFLLVVFFFVVPDTGGDACGDLGGADLGDAVAESGALTAGYGDSGERQEDPVGTEHLTECRSRFRRCR